MLGFRLKKPSYQKATQTTNSASPIMISDFVGKSTKTASVVEESRPTTFTTTLYASLAETPGKIITIPLLSRFLTKHRELEKTFNNAMVGKCDGEFPVTNPIENNIYFYTQDKKYYVCNESLTEVVSSPDGRFEEISLNSIYSKGTGAKSISITGDITGSGTLNEETGSLDVEVNLFKMSNYTKQIYSTITELDSPTIAIGKLEGALDNKASIDGTYVNMTVGTANKVSNNLTISLNGSNSSVFNGSESVTLNITPELINASRSDHNHDGVYQPVGNYSVDGHTHTKDEITDFPLTLANPYQLTIRFADSNVCTYDGSISKDITITPENIGAQPKGDYANAVHDHDLSYSKLGHTHGNEEITGIDASKINSGTIDIARLPAAALDRLVEVENDAARFALTKEDVQIGDTVQVTETLKMYRVINDDKLSTEEGYKVYVAGRAAEVPWSGVKDKPEQFNPSAHNQASDTINLMTGYTKGAEVSAISEEDTLNTAMGKLEFGIDNLQSTKLGVNDTAQSALVSESANKLSKPVNVNGVPFDGSSDINITATDDTKLPLTGGTITGSLTVLDSILSNGNVTAYSDRRVKQNIEPIKNSLDKVKKLQGVFYNLIGDDRRQIGLIAQDVQLVLPEVVAENENGMLSLDYSRLVALLINAINELSEEVNK